MVDQVTGHFLETYTHLVVAAVVDGQTELVEEHKIIMVEQMVVAAAQVADLVLVELEFLKHHLLD